MAVEGAVPAGSLLWAPFAFFGSSASVDEVRPTNIKRFRAMEYPELEGTPQGPSSPTPGPAQTPQQPHPGHPWSAVQTLPGALAASGPWPGSVSLSVSLVPPLTVPFLVSLQVTVEQQVRPPPGGRCHALGSPAQAGGGSQQCL